MNTRTNRKTVTFTQPFKLSGIEGELPPGSYIVETDEELIDDLSFVAWRRVATMIHLRSAGVSQVHLIDPVDLDASLLRDGGLTVRAADGQQAAESHHRG